MSPGQALIFSVLALASANAIAETSWTRYATSSNGYVLEWAPMLTTKSSAGVITTWVKETPPKPAEVFKAKPNGPKYVHLLSRLEVACNNSSIRYLAQHFYAKGGLVVHSDTAPDSFQAVVPDSVGSSLVEVVCAAME